MPRPKTPEAPETLDPTNPQHVEAVRAALPQPVDSLVARALILVATGGPLPVRQDLWALSQRKLAAGDLDAQTGWEPTAAGDKVLRRAVKTLGSPAGGLLTTPPILYSESPTTIADVTTGLAALGISVNGLEASALLTLAEGTWYPEGNHMMRRLSSLGVVEQRFGNSGPWRLPLVVSRLLTRLGVPPEASRSAVEAYVARRPGAPTKPAAERRTNRIPGFLTDGESAQIAHLTPDQIRRRILAPWPDPPPTPNFDND